MTALLDIRNLAVEFALEDATVHAVNGVSYAVEEGETLGIVGESGSGKSVHVLSLLRLIPMPPGRIVAGEAWFEGKDLLKLTPTELRELRGNRIAFIFQDPMSSLNPVLTIGRQLTEPLQEHLHMTLRQADSRAAELLRLARLPDPVHLLRRYPHELSGGMRQRVMIAMALSCNPKLLIADEPTTALDVTIQAEIVDLVRELKRELGMTVVWITHDLGVVAGLADTVQVMYAGRILERGPVDAVFSDPRNAYTLGLLRSLPDVRSRSTRRLYQIDGAPPDLRAPPRGDPFAPRNPFATERCRTEMPPLAQVPRGAAGHLAAAWYDLPAARAAQGAI
jgi:peptide/nickel transport system ATP-binding protein/oligopeptide transport system ATP-binding protein